MALQRGQVLKIRVLREYREPVLQGVFPDIGIICHRHANVPYMFTAREEVRQAGNKRWGQVLVIQCLHLHARQPAFPIGRKSEARRDVFVVQIRKLIEDLFPRHS